MVSKVSFVITAKSSPFHSGGCCHTCNFESWGKKMDKGDTELGACPIFSTMQQLWFFMTAHTCGKSPYESYCFAGHDTRGSQKTVPDSDLLLYLCTCAPPRQSTRTAGGKPSPVRGALGRLFRSMLSARQCVHQNSAWTGPVTYTLKGHLSGRSPVPPCTAASGRRQPGRQPASAGAGCVHAEIARSGSVMPLRPGNLLLPLESMYVTASYTIYESLRCFV